jgi:hypothetical protein
VIANPDEVLAFVHDVLAVISKHPELVKAVVAQYGK